MDVNKDEVEVEAHLKCRPAEGLKQKEYAQ
jgi:hypothetical protein